VEQGGTQAAGGADGGKSHGGERADNSKGPTDGGGAGGSRDQGVDREPIIIVGHIGVPLEDCS